MKRLLLACALPFAAAQASDLKVETTRVVPDAAAATVRVSARIAWQNAWKNARNNDAVWVFAKIRRRGGGNWSHARLRGVTAESSTPQLACTTPADKVGALCAPAATHRGPASGNLMIEIDATGAPPALMSPDSIEVRVYGIEMVYIPEGGFVVGDADTAAVRNAAFYKSDANGRPAGVFRVTGEGPIDIGPREGALFYQSANIYQGDRLGPLPAAFPKGTRAFYIMKYELSQGQYSAYLNTLNSPSSGFRANNGAVSYQDNRGTIHIVNHAYVADKPDRPANYLSWDDGLAFADWAALRPMTEFEFTKAARGPGDPVGPNDYPWGTTSKAKLLRRVGAAGDLASTGAASEAALSDDTKEVLGASYWWVMDLAGSVWEKVVTVGHPKGRAFRGTHGDGELDGYGGANTPDWPKGDDEAGGYGYRGGGNYEWSQERGRDPNARALNPYSPVEWRPYGSWGGAPRSVAYGFRAVRTAEVPAPAPNARQAMVQQQQRQDQDRDLVRAAVLDYVEGFYLGDSAKLVRSVAPDVFKYGYWVPRDSTKYQGERMTYPEFVEYANRVKASGRQTPFTAPRDIVLFDVLDQTASAKLTAYWGVDYLLLAKRDGRWMITHVMWQTPPK